MTDKQEKCYCDRMGIGVPGVSCGDCPTRDYKLPRPPESERIAALEREVEALRQWLSGDAFCPCCGMTDVCAADCTFAAEAPGDAAHMNEVRALLRGGVESPGATGIG